MPDSNNFLVERTAYEAAVKFNPRERWLLRDGIHSLSARARGVCQPAQCSVNRVNRVNLILDRLWLAAPRAAGDAFRQRKEARTWLLKRKFSEFCGNSREVAPRFPPRNAQEI